MLVAPNGAGKNMYTKFLAGNHEARIFLEDTVLIEWII
jgi:Fe-S cluster assembly ATPase SufC